MLGTSAASPDTHRLTRPAAWLRAPGATEARQGYCLVCGNTSVFDSWVAVTTDCKRNTFFCRYCGSVARNRQLARTILDLFPTRPASRSLAEFARRTRITLLHTCASGALHEALRGAPGYRVSEFYDGVLSGTDVNGVTCQDLEATTFRDATFDLVITEDVLEHVSDSERVCRELRRILRSGGYHVATLAVRWDQPRTVRRARLVDGRVEHLLPAEYHGDPNRAEGALVFFDFGADVVERYLSLTGATDVLWSNGVTADEEGLAIFHNMVFVSHASRVSLNHLPRAQIPDDLQQPEALKFAT